MRRIKITTLAVLALLGSGFAAIGQEGGAEEIVVTGSRITEYDPVRTPHVVLVKRADNLITQLTVVCDTRDESQRREELKATLRAMIKAAAQDPSIELGVGEDIVGRFDDTQLDKVLGPSKRADTSQATLLVKTRVTAADSFDAATARIEAFVKKTPKVGRTEVLTQGRWNLTLIGPERYRGDIIGLIAADSRRSAATFGDGYGVSVEGLNLPVSWYQSGPLDLSLYIPYKLVIAPAK